MYPPPLGEPWQLRQPLFWISGTAYWLNCATALHPPPPSVPPSPPVPLWMVMASSVLNPIWICAPVDHPSRIKVPPPRETLSPMGTC